MNSTSVRIVGWTIVIVLILVGGGLLSGVFGSVMIGPGFFGPVVLVGLAFIGLQALIFKTLGLRSRADDSDEEPNAEPESPDEDDRDWRAWRG